MKPLVLEGRAGTLQIHTPALDLSVWKLLEALCTVEGPWSSGSRKADRDQNEEETCCLGQAPVPGKKMECLGKFKRPIWQGLK